METLHHWLIVLRSLDVRPSSLGDTGITLWGLFAFIGFLIVLVYGVGRFQRWIADRLLAHAHHLDVGMRQAIASVLRYVLMLVGFLVIAQAFGINLTTLHLLVGPVGVGVRFGQQNITSNWINAPIIMFERPVRIGDRVEMAGIEGEISEIGARRTAVITRDDAVAIIPKSRLITDT